MMCYRCNSVYSDNTEYCRECDARLTLPFANTARKAKNRAKRLDLRNRKQESFLWEGHLIEICSVVCAKYLWTATLNQLWVDGNLVASMGGPGLAHSVDFRIDHQGIQAHGTLVMKMRWSIKGGGNYEFRMNGVSQRSGVVYPEIRWRP